MSIIADSLDLPRSLAPDRKLRSGFRINPMREIEAVAAGRSRAI
ncbi:MULTISPECIES: hypothetical protein [unclassified Mesorhizobium]|nr:MULTISPECIES: hypothetical protein [unclassified Mesorhizobium]